MPIIEIIYLIFATLAIAACLPQIRHLMRDKHSGEFEIKTWAVWLSAQVVATVYMLTIQAYLVAIMSAAWMAFYVVMVGLIMYYRRYPGGRQQPVEVTASVDS